MYYTTTGDVPGCKYIVRPLHTASSRLSKGRSANATQAGRGARPRRCALPPPPPSCRDGDGEEEEEEAAAAGGGREEGDGGGGGGGGGRAAARSTVKARPVSSRELA